MAADPDELTPTEKMVSTLAARAALQGCQLAHCADGSFIGVHGPNFLNFCDAHEVEAFLGRLEGAALVRQ